jgi:hypothetical protein
MKISGVSSTFEIWANDPEFNSTGASCPRAFEADTNKTPFKIAIAVTLRICTSVYLLGALMSAEVFQHLKKAVISHG